MTSTRFYSTGNVVTMSGSFVISGDMGKASFSPLSATVVSVAAVSEATTGLTTVTVMVGLTVTFATIGVRPVVVMGGLKRPMAMGVLITTATILTTLFMRP